MRRRSFSKSKGWTATPCIASADLGAATVYRHFACRDAITEALIDREAVTLLGVLCEVQAEADPQRRLARLIRAHIAHRRQWPRLVKILDFEEWRLRHSRPADRDPALSFVQTVISDDRLLACRSAEVAGDILAIVRGMAASPDGTSEQLEQRIRRTVAGYLDSCSAARSFKPTRTTAARATTRRGDQGQQDRQADSGADRGVIDQLQLADAHPGAAMKAELVARMVSAHDSGTRKLIEGACLHLTEARGHKRRMFGA
ncbi:MAG: hypothetical protein PGN16_11880 [Sphingomonas phyllosphaerae]|uniref:TetR/AcrR family transcriptional regulator n=1 Tax=Sphingomonas phyllosphaerae TaxID=257003 RepID=UPI002FF47639